MCCLDLEKNINDKKYVETENPETINQIVERSKKFKVDKVAAIESRGFVFASASPGAGLYAEGSLSDFLDCDLKYESRFVFVVLEIPLKYFAG